MSGVVAIAQTANTCEESLGFTDEGIVDVGIVVVQQAVFVNIDSLARDGGKEKIVAEDVAWMGHVDIESIAAGDQTVYNHGEMEESQRTLAG